MCQACDLWRDATQTVFGEGSDKAKVLMIDEQPGDKEDIEGRPFVGPAGVLLDKALTAAGIDRTEVYVTNAVKHFRWERRGKLRLHKKPNAVEIKACRPWLDAEIAALKPKVIVLLGATAAQSILGRSFRVIRQRGKWISSSLGIVRDPDHQSRQQAMNRFITDLKQVKQRMYGRMPDKNAYKNQTTHLAS